MSFARFAFALPVALAASILLAAAGATAGARPAPAGTDATPAVGPPAEAVAGRLGGTRTTFEATYGAPLTDDVGSGASYEVAGYGLVLVSFLAPANAPRPDDAAMVVVLRSPRPDDAPAAAPDPRDWSLAEARTAAARFLPRDAALAETPQAVDLDRGRLVSACRSEALASLYPTEADPGACRVTFLTPTATTVSFVTLALGGSSRWEVAADPCAGMTEWAPATGRRMTDAATMLEEIARFEAGDPDAPARLGAAAATFATVTEEQRGSEAPVAAAEANARLVAAFAAFAAAIEQAATGLAAAGDAVLAEAADAIAAAAALFRDADRLVLAALTACDLTE